MFVIKNRLLIFFPSQLDSENNFSFHSANPPEKKVTRGRGKGKIYFFYDYCNLQASLQAKSKPQGTRKAQQELN